MTRRGPPPDLSEALRPHQQLLEALHITPDPEVEREAWVQEPFDDVVGYTTSTSPDGW